MRLLTFLLVISTIITGCHSTKKITANPTNINKWEKASINIESVCDKYSIYQIWQALSQKRKNNLTYSEADSAKEYDILRDMVNNISGTAIYLAEGKNQYLITAKHVVHDENFTIRHMHYTKMDVKTTPKEYFEKLTSKISIKTPLSIYKAGKYNLYEIPAVSQDYPNRPFKFSNDAIDLAIISLQSKQTYNLRKLLSIDRYNPIDITDIDTSDNYQISDEVIAIGYPAFSNLGKAITKEKNINEDVVLPIVTFGRTALSDSALHYFIADITVNPGNSGGPILKNNKLIGIVSKQMLVDLRFSEHVDSEDLLSKVKSSSPLAVIIKSKYIFYLLEKMKAIENDPKFLLQENIP